jgi:hypothetical protein
MNELPPSACPELDALLARAEGLALFSMRARGSVAPTLLAVGAGGPICFIPSSLKDERAKDNFASIARLICVAHAATAAWMIIEAWMKTASPDGTLDLTVTPSESLHRREVVALTGESQAGYQQKILRIIRPGAGRFFGFGEFTTPPETTFSGRFAYILAPKASAAAEQKEAAALLAVLGVKAEGLRRDWSAN